MVVFIVLICVCVVLAAVLVGAMVRETKGGNMPPGPSGLPWFGQAFRMSINSAFLKFTQWSTDYGDVFMFSIFGRKVVVLNDPDIIRKTFSGSELGNKTSDRPPSFIGNFIGDSYKDILFRVYDDLCHKLKCATTKAMYSIDKENLDFDRLNRLEINEYIRKVTTKDGDIDLVGPLQHSLQKMIGVLVSNPFLS